MLLTKITAAQNQVELSYHRVRGLYFVAVRFVTTVVVYIYIYHTLYSVHCTVYTVEQGSPTFCGRWAKKRKNYKPFLLRAINSYFLPISPKFFDHLFISFFSAPQNLKRAIIFLKRATFGRRLIGWRPLL